MVRSRLIKLVGIGFSALALLTVLAVGILLRTPVLLPWRTWLTPLFFAVMAVGTVWLFKRAKAGHWRNTGWSAIAICWLASLSLAGTQTLQFQWYRHQVLQSTAAEVRQLGAHMVVGYRNIDSARELAQKGLIGGIFLSAENIKGRTANEIAMEIDSLQALRRDWGLPELLVCVDHEGGAVSRLTPPLPASPSLQALLALVPEADVLKTAYAYGLQHGRELASVGVNINLAPVADLTSPAGGPIAASRSLMHLRSISADPLRTAKAVQGYVRGLERGRVLGTVKHFPGLGRVAVDTHLLPASIDATVAELEQTDWIPFKAGLVESKALLMVGHVKLRAVDAQRLASQSPPVIDIVRTKWAHDGVLITDDLTMGAVLLVGTDSSGVSAIDSGIDLLLVSYDIDRYYEILYHLIQAKKNGALDESMLVKSDARLKALQVTLRP